MKKELLQWLLDHSIEEDFLLYVPSITKWLGLYGSINEAWVKPKVFRAFQENGFHLVRNHYYGVLPDTRMLEGGWWERPPYQSGYERIRKVDIDEQFRKVMRWSIDLQGIPSSPDEGFYWNNPMFPPLDAIVLYGMLREYCPERLIEIGSGFSTEISLMAASQTRTVIHCIEPYPSERLLEHDAQLQTIIQTPLQEVSLDIFKTLKANDFLFIDTTHTVKIGSDVNHLLFNVIPHLASGVIIHFHDIFLPFEYPRRWYDELSIFWNEQYLLLGYLMDNPTIELLLPNYVLSMQFKEQLGERFKGFDIWHLTENMGGASGASFWLRKI